MKPKNKMHPKMVRKLADYRKRKGKRKLRVQRIVRLTVSPFTRISKKLRLPFILHRSGKGKPGRGSCWVVQSQYPHPQDGSGKMIHAAAPTLPEALDKFYKRLSEPNTDISRAQTNQPKTGD